MTREELIADADRAVAEFAAQLAAKPQESTGIPKPPRIEVTESQLDPSKTNLQLGEGAFSGPPPEGGGGPGGGGFVYGACCDAENNCTIKTEEECASEGGTWRGGGTDCDPNPCTASCEAPTVQITGVSINPQCYTNDDGYPTNQSNKFIDLGFNITCFPAFESWSLNDWCGVTTFGPNDCMWFYDTGLLQVNNYGPASNPDPPPFQLPSHCDRPHTDQNFSCYLIVMRLSNHWYVWSYNPAWGPAALSIPFEIFYGDAVDSGGPSTTVPNFITAWDTTYTLHTRSGILADIYWGNCTTGSGDDDWVRQAQGGSVIITPA